MRANRGTKHAASPGVGRVIVTHPLRLVFVCVHAVDQAIPARMLWAPAREMDSRADKRNGQQKDDYESKFEPSSKQIEQIGRHGNQRGQQECNRDNGKVGEGQRDEEHVGEGNKNDDGGNKERKLKKRTDSFTCTKTECQALYGKDERPLQNVTTANEEPTHDKSEDRHREELSCCEVRQADLVSQKSLAGNRQSKRDSHHT